ncbi:MAG: HNH endonuclease [Halobacteriales archaeon]
MIERRLRWNEVEVRHTLSGDGEWEDPYGENWEKQREAALERAGYACEACGITDEEHRQRYVDDARGVGIGLDVHHVVRAGLFRKWGDASIEDANSLRNLRVFCQECHAQHGDRVGTY